MLEWKHSLTGLLSTSSVSLEYIESTHTHTHTRLSALCPGLLGWAGTRKVKPIWTLLKQETVSGSGISWAMCKSAPCSRQITTPAPRPSVVFRPDAQPTVSKHWRHTLKVQLNKIALYVKYFTILCSCVLCLTFELFYAQDWYCKLSVLSMYLLQFNITLSVCLLP